MTDHIPDELRRRQRPAFIPTRCVPCTAFRATPVGERVLPEMRWRGGALDHERFPTRCRATCRFRTASMPTSTSAYRAALDVFLDAQALAPSTSAFAVAAARCFAAITRGGGHGVAVRRATRVRAQSARLVWPAGSGRAPVAWVAGEPMPRRARAIASDRSAWRSPSTTSSARCSDHCRGAAREHDAENVTARLMRTGGERQASGEAQIVLERRN